MSYPEPPPLSALLRRSRRRLGLLLLMILLLLAGALVGGVLLLPGPPGSGLYTLPGALIAALALAVVRHRALRTHTQYARIGPKLLAEAPARDARLRFEGAAAAGGGYFATLSGEGLPTGVVVLDIGRYELPPPGQSEVRIYTLPDPQRLLLIERDGRLDFARRCEGEALRVEVRRSERLFQLLLYATPLMFALALLNLGRIAWEAHQAAAWGSAARGWPVAHGTLSRSAVEGFWEGRGRGGPRELFRADLHYRFEVEGRTLEGRLPWFSYQADERRAEAEALVARYPAGAAVTVRYDPADPRRAVLEPGHEEEALARRSNYLSAMAGFGTSGAIISLFVWGVVVRPSRRKLRGLLAVGEGGGRDGRWG